MELPEIVKITSDAFLAAAAFVTGVVAILGLKSWNRELRGKAQFDTAKGLAKATYKLRSEIAKYRSPVRIDEHPTPDDPTSWNLDVIKHVHTAREPRLTEAIREFEAQALEGEALWGNEIADPSERLVQQAQIPLDAAVAMYSIERSNRVPQGMPAHKYAMELHKLMYQSGPDVLDMYDTKVDHIIWDLERVLLPHLERHPDIMRFTKKMQRRVEAMKRKPRVSIHEVVRQELERDEAAQKQKEAP